MPSTLTIFDSLSQAWCTNGLLWIFWDLESGPGVLDGYMTCAFSCHPLRRSEHPSALEVCFVHPGSRGGLGRCLELGNLRRWYLRWLRPQCCREPRGAGRGLWPFAAGATGLWPQHAGASHGGFGGVWNGGDPRGVGRDQGLFVRSFQGSSFCQVSFRFTVQVSTSCVK